MSISPRRVRLSARTPSASRSKTISSTPGGRSPGVGRALEPDALAALPAREPERPGADGLAGDRRRLEPGAADEVVGEDGQVAQRAQHEIRRALEDEADGPLGHELDRGDVRERGAEDGRVGAGAQQRLDGRLHVQHPEGPAIVPAHAAAHPNRHAHAIVRHVPALREPRAIAAVAAVEQRLVDEPGGHLGRRGVVGERQQVRRLRVEVHAQRSRRSGRQAARPPARAASPPAVAAGAPGRARRRLPGAPEAVGGFLVRRQPRRKGTARPWRMTDATRRS